MDIPSILRFVLLLRIRRRLLSLAHLGHIIFQDGIEVDKAKTDLIINLPPPTCVKEVRSFLGHAGFYRRFIKDFSKIAKPLSNLLAKDVPFHFSEECHQAFSKLKKA